MKPKAKKAFVVGVAGPSGAGKSEVCGILQGRGYTRLDVDKIAKGLYKKGNLGYSRIKRLFGAQIIGAGGHISRKKLAEIIFSDAVQKKKLDRALFPLINKAVQDSITMKQRIGIREICLDMAILFHSRADRLCAKIILVLDTPVRREARLRKRGLSAVRAKAQASSLKFNAREKSRASFVLYNRGSKADLKRRVLSFAEKNLPTRLKTK